MILDDIVAKKEVRLHERMERIPLLQLKDRRGIARGCPWILQAA